MSTWTRLTEDTYNTLLASFVFVSTLVVYTITLTPDVPFWDGGEFIATSYILGVPHAPGTPLYVLIGRMFTLIPIGNIAERVNWLSALSSSIAILFTYLITVKVSRKAFPLDVERFHRPLGYIAGIVAALIAAFATTFWDNAIEAEVYAASCALFTFVVWLVLRWEERLDEGTEDGLLLIITYMVGLGMGIHLGVAIAAWAAVIYVFLQRPQYLTRWDYLGWGLVTLSLATGVHGVAFWVAPAVLALTLGVWLVSGKFRKLAFWASLLFMVGVSVHFFLIIRSNLDPMINEAAPKTWDSLWKMLIRDQYKPPPVWQRKADWPYQFDFMWLRYIWWNLSLTGEKAGLGYGAREFIRGFLQPTILLFVAGAVAHFLRARKSALLFGVLFLLLGPLMVVYLNFRVGEVRERDYFFVQNFQFMAIWVGLGAAWFVDWIRRQFKSEGIQRFALAGAGTLLVAMSFMPLIRNWEEHDRRGFHVARNYAYNMLAGLEKDAVIFTNGDNDTFPLWYIQEVEGVRKDVRVVNLSLLNTDWYIKQLRDLEPKVPMNLDDGRIAQLIPYRDRNGRIWMVKDIAVDHIIKVNQWKRPMYLAVTVPDQMGFERQLSMEGLVFRMNPDPVTERIDLERTLHNLNEVFDFTGLVRPDLENPENTFGVYDSLVYKDENATKLVQNYAAAFTRVALTILDRGNPEDALNMMNRAQAISPNFPGVAVARGVILEELGRLDDARQHYLNMLNAYPRDWQLVYRLGELLVKEEKVEEAVGYFQQAMEYAPTDQFYPYQALASSYYQLGRYEDAANVLQRWLILHPDDQNVRPLYEDLRRSLSQGRSPGQPDTAAGSGAEPAAPDE